MVWSITSRLAIAAFDSPASTWPRMNLARSIGEAVSLQILGHLVVGIVPECLVRSAEPSYRPEKNSDR